MFNLTSLYADVCLLRMVVALFGLLSGPPSLPPPSPALSLVGCLLNIVAAHYREAHWSGKVPLARSYHNRHSIAHLTSLCEQLVAWYIHRHQSRGIKQHLSLGQSCVGIRT